MKLFDYKYKRSYLATQVFFEKFFFQSEVVKMRVDFMGMLVLLALPKDWIEATQRHHLTLGFAVGWRAGRSKGCRALVLMIIFQPL
jgi:hypothetical protein